MTSTPDTARVILFKANGKYYTEEDWRVPADGIGPWVMRQSPDFRRIDNGAVMVTSDRWGFPCLLPPEADTPEADGPRYRMDDSARNVASRLEELTPAAIEIVKRLREGVSRDQAYALVYQYRYEVGRLLTSYGLGAGAPVRHARVWADDVIAQQTGDSRI